MGSFSGEPGTLGRAIDSLRDDFGPDCYNVLTRNCNTFASALCEELLGKPIPGYVNRLAWMGEKAGLREGMGAGRRRPGGGGGMEEGEGRRRRNGFLNFSRRNYFVCWCFLVSSPFPPSSNPNVPPFPPITPPPLLTIRLLVLLSDAAGYAGRRPCE